MDTPVPARSALYRHLHAHGRMGRKNPELLRLSRKSGLSVEHLFQVALGRRKLSVLAARELVRQARNPEVTEASLPVALKE